MENQPVPNVTFKTVIPDNKEGSESCSVQPLQWYDLTTDEIFVNKTVLVFGLPGAFTPVCSTLHLPGFEVKYQALRDLGIDDVYCLSVNDTFVMNAWAKRLKIKNIKMLPDGNGEFTQAMGMLVNESKLQYGYRSWRYSMLVNDGIIEKIFEEEGKGDNAPSVLEFSNVETMLYYLRHR